MLSRGARLDDWAKLVGALLGVVALVAGGIPAFYSVTGFFDDEARLVCHPRTYEGLTIDLLEQKLIALNLNVARVPSAIQVTSKAEGHLYLCRFTAREGVVTGNKLYFR